MLIDMGPLDRVRIRRNWHRLVAIVYCLQVASITMAGDWPMFRGGNERSGYAEKEQLPDRLDLLWVHETKGSLESSPVVVGETVYQGSCDGNLYAVDVADGSPKWVFPAGGVIMSTPVVDSNSGLVVFGCNNNYVYAIGMKNGELAWEHATAPPSRHVILHGNQVKASPALSGSRILVGNYGGQWMALAAKNGDPEWKAKGLLTFASPATDGKRVVMADLAGITCLQADTGKELWQRKEMGSFLASPSIRGKTVYTASAGQVAKQSRSFTIGILPNEARMGPGPPAPVAALNLKTGNAKWETKVPDRVIASPTVTEKLVIVADTRGQVTAMDAEDGAIRWTFQATQGIWASPVATQKELVVASTDGFLYRLRLRDGGLVWKFDTGSPLYASPAISNGRLFVANESGYLMAFGSGKTIEHPLEAREPRDMSWAMSQPLHDSFWDLVGRVESYKSAPMKTWSVDEKNARYRRDRGKLVDFLMQFRVESGGDSRHDLNLDKQAEIRNGQVITVCSRPPTTYNRLHVSPTQADLEVDWTKKPRVRMICTLENPFNPLVEKGSRPFCTYLVQMQPIGEDQPPKEHWPIWHHNNWIHFTTQLEETGHVQALGDMGLDFVGWGLCDERIYPRYYPSHWWREMRLRLYTQRTVDFYRIARNPQTERFRALAMHTPGVFEGDPKDEMARRNIPPKCSIRADRLSGKAPLRVRFRAEASDSDGQVLWQTWDFDAKDDMGIDSSRAVQDWEFKNPGRYTVSLTVMDNFLTPAHDHVVVNVSR